MIIKPTANVLLKQDAGTDVNFDISAWDITNATTVPLAVEEQGALSTTAAALLTTPASGHSINVTNLKVTNTGASTRTVTVYRPEDGSTVTAATTRDIFVLLPNEGAEWTPAGWVLYDANGREQGVIIAATQTDQETSTSVTTYVSPGTQHFHPSAAKFWIDEAGAGTTTNASYNVTSVTDTGAGRMTVNINVDFSAANYAVVATVERAVTTLAVTDLKFCNVRNAAQLAGSVEIECYDGTATTAVQEDPQSYYVVGFGDV